MPSKETTELLTDRAELLRAELGVAWLSISRFAGDALATLVNVGALDPGEERNPQDERYPLDAFPALAALSRGEPYAFAGIHDADVSSAALAYSFGLGPQAAVPIRVRGDVWGELWIADPPGATPYAPAQLAQLAAAADALASLLGD